MKSYAFRSKSSPINKVSSKREIIARMLRDLNLRCTENEDAMYVKRCYKDVQNRCVPGEYLGEDILDDINSKFYYFFRTIADEAERKLGIDISVIIEPSYEGRTSLVAYAPNESIVLLDFSCKAWHFGGYGKKLGNVMYEHYKVMCDNYMQLKAKMRD